MKFSGLFCLFFLVVLLGRYGEAQPLIVGTYNLRNLGNPIGLEKDLQELPLVDIWAFQEVMFRGRTPFSTFSKLLPKEGFWRVSAPISIKDSSADIWEGHAIVSRFPIEQTGIIPLQQALVQARAALYAIININGKRILFINTDHDIDHWQVGYLERQKNIRSLLAGIERLNFDGPQIVVGDFNTADSYPNWVRGLRGRDEIRLTQQDFINQGWQTPASQHSDPYTFSQMGIKQQLDHFFFKGLFSSTPWRRLDSREGSDHYPLFFKAELPSP